MKIEKQIENYKEFIKVLQATNNYQNVDEIISSYVIIRKEEWIKKQNWLIEDDMYVKIKDITTRLVRRTFKFCELNINCNLFYEFSSTNPEETIHISDDDILFNEYIFRMIDIYERWVNLIMNDFYKFYQKQSKDLKEKGGNYSRSKTNLGYEGYDIENQDGSFQFNTMDSINGNTFMWMDYITRKDNDFFYKFEREFVQEFLRSVY